MTVAVQTPFNSYTANGITTVYAFSFLILSSSDLVVQTTDAAGVTTVKTIGVDYTVSGVGAGGGGTVTFLAAPTNGHRVDIYRRSLLLRSTDYQDNGDLLADVLNIDFDRIWLVLQEMLRGNQVAQNVIKAQPSESLNTLVAAASRLDKLLGFNFASGQPEVSTFTMTQLASVIAAVYASSSGPLDALTFIQAGSGAESRSAQEKMREHVSILDFIPVAEHAAIKARTSTYDCYPSIIEAINSVSNPVQGSFYTAAPAIYFPAGKYLVNSTLDLKKTVRLWGDDSGLQPGIGPELKFPAGKHGIIVNHYNTLAGGVEAVPTISAAGTIIEGLRIVGGGGATSHGIWLRARTLVKNVYVEGFSGNGINVRAAAGLGGDLEGNANNFRLEGGSCVSNTGHGIFVVGADANAGWVSAWDCTSNGGWGFYDSSFLGNTYVACHTDANTLGGYKSDNVNARNMFLNCYSEGGQPTNSVVNPSMVLGGLHSPGFGVSDPWIENSGGLKAPSWSLKSTDQLCTIGIGQGAAVNDIMSISRSGNDPWTLQHANGRVYWDWANSNNQFLTFYDKTDANIANGYARDVASIYTDGPPVGLGFGYMDGNMRLRATSTVIPSSGTSLLGDIYWHGSPAAGGKAGWICTTGGINGSTAVLKPFGPIDP